MKKFASKVVAVVLAVLFAMSFAACSGKKAEASTIKVGVLAPLTGAVAQYGNAVNNGVKMYFEELNAKGGINGKQVELVTYDEEGDPVKAVTGYSSLLDQGVMAAKKRGAQTKKYRDGTPLDKLPSPIWDGDGFRADGYTPFGPECKGMWVFTASCSADRKPAVVDASGNPILDASEIYSGIWGRVSVDFFPYNFNGKQGVGCALCNAQKLFNDAPLGAPRPSAEDDFGVWEGDDPEYDPFA